MFGTPEYKVKATVDVNGDLSVRVTASCGYGSRSVSRTADVTLDEKDAAKVAGILKKAIEAATVTVVVGHGKAKEEREIALSQQVLSDAAESLVVATKKGEEL